MNRTKYLLPTIALSLVASGSASAKPPPVRPNIVIFLADDWGFSDVGAFGGEIATPNIDMLAARGVRFSNFHVAGSCSPTRAMLQTGVINHRAGLGNMAETIPSEHLGRPGYQAALNDRVVTIGDQLRLAGYRTYLTGKWHLGKTADTLPTSRGYDRAFALSQSGADNFTDKPNLLLYEKADWSEGGKPAKIPKDFYSSRFVIDKMISYIEDGRASGKPFLASINFLANHIPVQASDADIAAYAKRYRAGWTVLRNERRAGAIAKGVMPTDVKMVSMPSTADWSRLTEQERNQRAGAMAAYGAMATAMDREIGRFVAHLKARGDFENSIFVFLSDNGAEPTDPMHMGAFTRWNANHYYDQSVQQQGRSGSLTAIGAGFASAASSPLRGYKFTANEGGLRVPLIIAWPGNHFIKAGSIANGFAHVTDVAPTLLALAEVAPQKGSFSGRSVEPMIGRDLRPLLTGAGDAVHPADAPFGYELSGNAALFKGDWKLVKNLPPYGTGAWSLFNIKRDPGETSDQSALEPARFTVMQADYADFAKANGVLPMPEGYTAPDQIFEYSIREVAVPRLLRLLPWIIGLIGLAGWLVYRWRRSASG